MSTLSPEIERRVVKARELHARDAAQEERNWRGFVIAVQRGQITKPRNIESYLHAHKRTHDDLLAALKVCAEFDTCLTEIEELPGCHAVHSKNVTFCAAEIEECKRGHDDLDRRERAAKVLVSDSQSAISSRAGAFERLQNILGRDSATVQAHRLACIKRTALERRVADARDAATWNRRSIDDLARRAQTMDEDRARSVLADVSAQRARLADADRLPELEEQLRQAEAEVETTRQAILSTWAPEPDPSYWRDEPEEPGVKAEKAVRS